VTRARGAGEVPTSRRRRRRPATTVSQALRGNGAHELAAGYESDPAIVDRAFTSFCRVLWPALAAASWLRYQETGHRWALAVEWHFVCQAVADPVLAAQRALAALRFLRGVDGSPLAALLEGCDPEVEIVVLCNLGGESSITRARSSATRAHAIVADASGTGPAIVSGLWLGEVIAADEIEGRSPPPVAAMARAH
jgi:hypothetical protein